MRRPLLDVAGRRRHRSKHDSPLAVIRSHETDGEGDAFAWVTGIMGPQRRKFFLSPDLTPAEASRLVCPTAVQPGWLIGTMMIRRASFARVAQLAESLQVGDFVDWAHRARGMGLRALNLPEVLLHRRLHARNLSRIGRGDRGDFLKIARAALGRHRALNDGTADSPFPAG